MLVTIGSILMVLLAMASAGFGVYEFLKSEITNALLSFILSVVALNLTVNWKEAFED